MSMFTVFAVWVVRWYLTCAEIACERADLNCAEFIVCIRRLLNAAMTGVNRRVETDLTGRLANDLCVFVVFLVLTFFRALIKST